MMSVLRKTNLHLQGLPKSTKKESEKVLPVLHSYQSYHLSLDLWNMFHRIFSNPLPCNEVAEVGVIKLTFIL